MNPHGRRGHVLSIDDLLTTRLRARSTWLTVVKASAAATIAWVIADHLTTTTIPVLAPVLALGTVLSSLYSTLAQGLQSVVGNLIGVALALLMVDLWGISNVIVFAAAFASLALARFLPLNSGARDQAPFISIGTSAVSNGAAGLSTVARISGDSGASRSRPASKRATNATGSLSTTSIGCHIRVRTRSAASS
jgi:hypothetical protein